MSLLDRSPSYGRVKFIRTRSVALGNLENDPFSCKFVAKVGDTPKDLFRYMLACQATAYSSTILSAFPNQPMHYRHLKYLLQRYSPDTIKRAIKYASLRCHRPFSVKWVREYCPLFEDICPKDLQIPQ